MLTRNLLKAGEYAVLVPDGILVTLQYKPTGTLDKVLIGITNDDNYSELTENEILYSECIKHSKVPNHLSTNGGSLFVEGVIYAGDNFEGLGYLPNCLYDDMLNKIKNESVQFNFFAANVKSTSIQFSGYAQIQNWLKYQGYNILPGCIVPIHNVETTFKNVIQNSNFSYEHISSIFNFSIQGCMHNYLNHIQNQINDLDVYLDNSGCVRCNLKFKDTSIISNLSISYYEMLQKDVNLNDVVILDSNMNILDRENDQTNINYEYICPFCGKHYIVNDEFAKCSDVHCLSRMYNNITHFLKRLNLPEISYDSYIKYVQDKVISKFSDILIIDIYQDLMIETSVFDILDAIIPIESIRDRQVIWSLCLSCNNSLDSIYYYLDNPSEIYNDLNIDSQELTMYLSDKQNVSDIKEIIQYTNIILNNDIKKFEGSPIFRGKKIYITGDFIHGSYSEIESILRSYSAEISDSLDADCCIIGDKQTNINGRKVNELRSRNIPIFNESSFFDMYDIDSDLNL